MRTVIALLPVLVGAALLLALSPKTRAENWSGFRGPTGLGYSSDANLPTSWGGPERKNVRWASPLHGQGHASPVVWGDRVFVCTAAWPAGTREGEREKVMPEHHVACYDIKDGTLRWDVTVPPGPWLRTDFRSGPGGGYAGPTPATDGTRVYVAFGSSVLAALDFDGKIVWRKEIVPYTFDVTLGSSPVLFGDTVILLCAMAKPEDSRVVAFDAATGAVKWERPLPETGFGHTTPVVIDVGGKPQMLVLASAMKVTDKALQSLDPRDGKVLWWCRGAGDAASPAYGAGIVYFDNGRGGPGFAVDPAGAAGDASATHTRWTIKQIPEGLASPIIVGPYLYRLHTPGVLRCYEAATGKPVYSERLDGLSTTWASPIADPAGRIFFASAGRSYVIQGGPEFKVLSVNDLDDANHPSPAAAGGRLFLVGKEKLWCVGLGE
jgi:outer membrane protein assembly factor BamB